MSPSNRLACPGRSVRAILWLVLTSFGLYGILAFNHYLYLPRHVVALSPYSIPFFIFLVLLVAQTVAFYFVPYKYWMYLLVCFIPLEISDPFSIFPVLSPIDYFCAAALAAMVFRLGPQGLIKRVIYSFESAGIFLWTGFLTYGLIDAYFLSGNGRGVLRWGEFLFAYVLGRLAADQEPNLLYELTLLLSLIGATVSGLGILQAFMGGGKYTKVIATFGQHNVLAAFLSLCLPLCYGLSNSEARMPEALKRSAFFLILSAFLLSYSRGAWMGIVIGSLFIIWTWHNSVRSRSPQPLSRTVLTSILLALAVFVLTTHTWRTVFTLTDRRLYWKASFHILKNHPWFGLGPGNYADHIKQYLSAESLKIYMDDLAVRKNVDFWQHLHNLYLQIAVEYGLVGLLIWAGGLFYLVQKAFRVHPREELDKNSLRPYAQISIIAFLVHNLVDILTVTSLDLLFIFLVALSSTPDRADHSD